jgi:DNA-binding NtrC family response regulator
MGLHQDMQPEILFVANSDADSNAIVEAVAKKSGCRLRKVSGTRQAFDILANDFDNVDVVIIDLDPGMDSLAILEAIGGHPVAPPVIALTSLQESKVTPVASRHGAVACLGKPFQHANLSKAIEHCLARPRSMSCDLWGHPRKRHRHGRAPQAA